MKVFKRLMGWLCAILAFSGAIVGLLMGLYFTFDFVFSGVFESFTKVIQHGNGSSKDEIRNMVLWICVVWGSKLLIPLGGLVGMIIGWLPGYFLIEYTE